MSEKTGARLNGQLAPAAGTQIGAGIQGDRLFASYAGLCRYCSQKRTVRLTELKRRRRRQSLLRADLAAETAAGALMRQKRHIIAPGTFGTGGAKKGSRRADAGADPAGCAVFFKMREHPGKAGSDGDWPASAGSLESCFTLWSRICLHSVPSGTDSCGRGRRAEAVLPVFVMSWDKASRRV